VPKDVIINMKGPQMVWVPKEIWSPWNSFGGFGGLAHKLKWRFKPKKLSSQLGHLIAQVPHKVMVAKSFNSSIM
jgi:hypothetical protein